MYSNVIRFLSNGANHYHFVTLSLSDKLLAFSNIFIVEKSLTIARMQNEFMGIYADKCSLFSCFKRCIPFEDQRSGKRSPEI